ncbi:phage holin family protein [Nocardioides gilvus]|uniref:phage holin family protein n=1 Tax=Nocardioides gilvus TaxID=1735589 RepID=UPI000D746A20|nr:phage holin family protein [Nocardioides gilvus]
MNRPEDPVEVTRASAAGAASPLTPGTAAQDSTTGQLVSQLSSEVTQLVRDELRLAQMEVSGKAKKAGVGIGMFGAAGVIALYGLAALLTAIVLALALVVDAWLAALIVAVVLFLVAGVAALLGKKRVEAAAPPLPTQTVASVKEDVDAVRNPGAHH